MFERICEVLTPWQREVLAVVIATADQRKVAETLGMSHNAVKQHLEDIKQELALPSNCIELEALSIGASFMHRGTRYTKCPQATDRFGGYNAEDEDGRRKLFLRHEVVERAI